MSLDLRSTFRKDDPANALSLRDGTSRGGSERGSHVINTEQKEIRVGVVGVGYWGVRHMRVLRSANGVAAVIGIDQRYAADGSGGLADPDVEYAELADALDSVDAVVIATPPSSHAALGLQALGAGKHVLIEKPLATKTTEARALIEAAEAAGVLLMPGHTFEHNSAVHKLRELVRSGELGRLHYLNSARLNLGLYQNDVNVIWDLAPHDVSIANFVLSARPTTVTAWGSRHIHPEHEDVAHLRLDYAEAGVQVNINVSWLDPRKIRQMTAVGQTKMVIYDDTAEERIRIYDKAAIPPEADDGPLSKVAYHIGDVVSPYIASAEPLAVQDQHFVDCILSGTRPAPDGDSGLAVVHALECAQISLAEHRPVDLAEISLHHAIPAFAHTSASLRFTS
jgi:predicted dehydrogenase